MLLFIAGVQPSQGTVLVGSHGLRAISRVLHDGGGLRWGPPYDGQKSDRKELQEAPFAVRFCSPHFWGFLAQGSPGSIPRSPTLYYRKARIGVAKDASFCYYYRDNLYLLEKAGAEIVFFSPMNDSFPESVQGLYLSGGLGFGGHTSSSTTACTGREVGVRKHMSTSSSFICKRCVRRNYEQL